MSNAGHTGKIGYSFATDFSSNDILYMLKDLPDACCIFKVLTDPFGTVKDMLFLFANEKYAQLVGVRSSAELIGTTYFKTVSNQDEDWIRFSYQAAILRQSSINRTYNSQFDKWFEFWAVPVYQKGFCAYIIHDVTADKRNEDTRASQINTNNLIIECAKAISTPDFTKGLKRILKKIGQSIEADRVYVVRNEGSRIRERYDWISKSCSSDLPSKKIFEKYDMVEIWKRQLAGKNVFCMNDITPVAETNPEMYQEHLAGKCQRYIVTIMKDRDEEIGFLVADNYSLEIQLDIVEVMESAAAFIASHLKNHDLTEELLYLGEHDSLTGLGNRHALEKDKLAVKKSSGGVGVCYTDINGLKGINDEKGHDHGDKIICSTAGYFANIFKKKYCYRIGGDEFLAIVPDIEKEKFDELIEKLRLKLKGIAVAIGAEWTDAPSDIENVIKKADEEMYKDKDRYYKVHERRHANNT